MSFDFDKINDDTFKRLSDTFSLERAGEIINNEIFAFFCSNKYPSSIQTIDFKDIFEDDILIHNETGKRCIIVDVKPLRRAVIVKYETETQRAREQQKINNISIGSISGSAIIGNQQFAIIDNSSITNLKEIISNKVQDKELLEKLLNLLEIIIEDNQPISKGTFSKFADIFRKYPDVFNAVGAIITKWISSIN